MKITHSQIRKIIKAHRIDNPHSAIQWLEQKRHTTNKWCQDSTCGYCDYRTSLSCFHKALSNVQIEDIPHLLDVVSWQTRMLNGELDLEELKQYYCYIKKAYQNL